MLRQQPTEFSKNTNRPKKNNAKKPSPPVKNKKPIPNFQKMKKPIERM